MRGIGHTLSRLPAARAVLAGAAILAGALASAAHAGAPGSGNGTGNDETAMAIPRMSLRGVNAGISLPQPLSPSDAALLRRAFTLQDRGNIPAASRLADEVQDPLLRGHLLADRYLGRFHHSTAAELTAWLDHYADQPDAPAIRALLLLRLPKGSSAPPVPAVAALVPAPALTAATEDADLQTSAIARNPALDAAVAARLQRHAAYSALHLIAGTRGLHADYASLLRGEVARWLFSHNEDEAALHTAYLALHDTPAEHQAGLAAYVGGLAAWRMDRLVEARGLFELAAEAPCRIEPHRRGRCVLGGARGTSVARSDRGPALAGTCRVRADNAVRLAGAAAARPANRHHPPWRSAVAGRCRCHRGDRRGLARLCTDADRPA